MARSIELGLNRPEYAGIPDMPEAQREKPDKQAKRPGTGKQEDSLISHYNRGTRHPRPPRQFVEIYW